MRHTSTHTWFARLATGLGVLLVAMTGCDVPPDADPSDEIEAQIQAQANQETTSCTGTGSGPNDIPGKFVEHCALWGGEYTRCSGGVAECCKTGTDSDGDSYEHCTTAPRVGPTGVDLNVPGADLVLENPTPISPPRVFLPTTFKALAP